MKKCPRCGLNPNDSQNKEQQKWESDYIKENGMCSSCSQEEEDICPKCGGDMVNSLVGDEYMIKCGACGYIIIR